MYVLYADDDELRAQQVYTGERMRRSVRAFSIH